MSFPFEKMRISLSCSCSQVAVGQVNDQAAPMKINLARRSLSVDKTVSLSHLRSTVFKDQRAMFPRKPLLNLSNEERRSVLSCFLGYVDSCEDDD